MNYFKIQNGRIVDITQEDYEKIKSKTFIFKYESENLCGYNNDYNNAGPFLIKLLEKQNLLSFYKRFMFVIVGVVILIILFIMFFIKLSSFGGVIKGYDKQIKSLNEEIKKGMLIGGTPTQQDITSIYQLTGTNNAIR